MTPEHFDQRMRTHGWVVFDRVVPQPLVKRMLEDFGHAYDTCRALQLKNGIGVDTPGTLHHLIGLGDSFLDLLAELPVSAFIERYFGGKFILNSFGGNINSRDHASYAGRVHRDIRTYSGDQRVLLNTLVMLDDFTEENGATRLLGGGHRLAERPGDEYFTRHSEPALGASGSVLMFDSNLWHAAGVNRTDRPRRSVTPMFSKPWFKPGFDYPRVLGYERVAQLAPQLQQILGYYARIPASLEEWYQPPERRMYRGDQG